MPCCPSCNSNKHVGNNGFRENHYGRLIVGVKETYYVIGIGATDATHVSARAMN